MTSRTLILVAAFLCAALAFDRPASAQSQVSLRASYQGQFLPEDTEIIVLSKEGREQRDGRYQPEFFSTRAFPRSGPARRDRLGNGGLSNRRYAATQPSGRLYFIYALTPDSTLYWSYSAPRDSLKFDVVSTGVMSVAPVLVADLREPILRSFFSRRVTVVMPGDDGNADEDETVLNPADSARLALHQASLDSTSVTTVEGQASVRDSALVDTAPSRSGVPTVASATPPAWTASTGGVSPFVFWSILVIVLGAAGVPVYLARTYRGELKQVRREMLTLRDRMASSSPDITPDDSSGDGTIRPIATPASFDPPFSASNPDMPDALEAGTIDRLEAGSPSDLTELRSALEDAALRQQQLEEDYSILQARYEALLKEVESLRTT